MSWLKGTDGDLEKELKKKKQQEEKEKKQALEEKKMEEVIKRFEIILGEELKLFDSRQFNIVKDKKTGVCYLMSRDLSGSGFSGITVLLDKDGKPFIDG